MKFMGVLGLLFWSLWLIRKFLARGYAPETRSFWTTTSVVVPVYDEELSVVDQCITSIRANNPTEIIVVFNGGHGYEGIERKHSFGVKFLHQDTADKRYAMALGMAEATSELVVFADSDVIWERNTLRELIKPFKDPHVGGVCTNQVIDNADASIWTTLGSWLTYLGMSTGTPFQSVKQCVSCLRGRTAAYRKNMVLSFVDDFSNEIFLGKRCKSGDDGRLTFLTLRAGYGTVFQATSIVHTTLPEGMQKFLNHRLRCNRNTFRRYASSILQGWFWHQNWRFLVELLASVIIPLGFVNCVAGLLYSIWEGQWPYLVCLFAWFCIGRSLRGVGWLKKKPRRLLRIPLMVPCFLFILTTVRWYALFTMNEQGWLTRGRVEMGKNEIKRRLSLVFTVALTVLVLFTYSKLERNAIPQGLPIIAAAVPQVVPTKGQGEIPTATLTPVIPMVSVAKVKGIPTPIEEPTEKPANPEPTLGPTEKPTQKPQPSIGNNLLVGAFLPDFPPERNLNGFEEKINRQLDIVTWFQNWNQPAVSNKLQIACRRGIIPLITWESWSGRKAGGIPYDLAEIAAGDYDRIIRSQLKDIGSTCSGTVLIRFNHEMNTKPGVISWYPWQGDPDNYIAAWQRVVGIGRVVAPNIKWIWSPAWGNADALLYYPGEEYVDYVGLTVLNFWRNEFDLRPKWWRWRSFEELYQPQREYLLSFGKPVIFVEVATGEGSSSDDKAMWIAEMFQYVRSCEEVVALVWFNKDHAREFEDIKWPLESSPQSLEAFRRAVP